MNKMSISRNQKIGAVVAGVVVIGGGATAYAMNHNSNNGTTPTTQSTTPNVEQNQQTTVNTAKKVDNALKQKGVKVQEVQQAPITHNDKIGNVTVQQAAQNIQKGAIASQRRADFQATAQRMQAEVKAQVQVKQDTSLQTNEVTWYSEVQTGSVHTRVTGLNIRSGASLNSPVIASVAKGSNLQVLGHDGNWYLIKTSNGVIGFVDGAFLNIHQVQQDTQSTAPVSVRPIVNNHNYEAPQESTSTRPAVVHTSATPNSNQIGHVSTSNKDNIATKPSAVKPNGNGGEIVNLPQPAQINGNGGTSQNMPNVPQININPGNQGSGQSNNSQGEEQTGQGEQNTPAPQGQVNQPQHHQDVKPAPSVKPQHHQEVKPEQPTQQGGQAHKGEVKPSVKPEQTQPAPVVPEHHQDVKPTVKPEQAQPAPVVKPQQGQSGQSNKPVVKPSVKPEQTQPVPVHHETVKPQQQSGQSNNPQSGKAEHVQPQPAPVVKPEHQVKPQQSKPVVKPQEQQPQHHETVKPQQSKPVVKPQEQQPQQTKPQPAPVVKPQEQQPQQTKPVVKPQEQQPVHHETVKPVTQYGTINIIMKDTQGNLIGQEQTARGVVGSVDTLSMPSIPAGYQEVSISVNGTTVNSLPSKFEVGTQNVVIIVKKLDAPVKVVFECNGTPLTTETHMMKVGSELNDSLIPSSLSKHYTIDSITVNGQATGKDISGTVQEGNNVIVVNLSKKVAAPVGWTANSQAFHQAVAQEFATLLANQRAQAGVGSLPQNADANEIAQLWSNHMMQEGVCEDIPAHITSPEIEKLGGEVGGLNQTNSAVTAIRTTIGLTQHDADKLAQQIFELWMNSPLHRSALDATAGTSYGFAFTVSSNGSVYACYVNAGTNISGINFGN